MGFVLNYILTIASINKVINGVIHSSSIKLAIIVDGYCNKKILTTGAIIIKGV